MEFAVKALGIKKAAVIFDQGNYGKEMAGLVRDGLNRMVSSTGLVPRLF